jgi:peptidoglycan/xylan/chitin deacetylase (PgdA/CDA1 family)
MNNLVIYCTITALAVCLTASAKENPHKIAIIKADDIRCPTDKWDRFFALSTEKNIKVSAGIICSSLQDETPENIDWLQKLQATGMVEFWNHGWDHKRWMDDDGNKIREFSGTGYDHQKKHFDDSQKLMKSILGTPPVAFGAPYNATDSTTARVMNEDSNVRLFFCYQPDDGLSGEIQALMKLRGEYDGTGKPNFEKFKEKYSEADGLTFTALQFHPNAFDDGRLAEYEKILDFLISEGWTFMLPSEYVAMVDRATM